MMSTWFVAVNGQSNGPYSGEQIVNNLAAGLYTRETQVWQEGYADWQPIDHVPELRGASRSQQSSVASPPDLSGRMAHEIDYEIFGHEMHLSPAVLWISCLVPEKGSSPARVFFVRFLPASFPAKQGLLSPRLIPAKSFLLI